MQLSAVRFPISAKYLQQIYRYFADMYKFSEISVNYLLCAYFIPANIYMSHMYSKYIQNFAEW